MSFHEDKDDAGGLNHGLQPRHIPQGNPSRCSENGVGVFPASTTSTPAAIPRSPRYRAHNTPGCSTATQRILKELHSPPYDSNCPRYPASKTEENQTGKNSRSNPRPPPPPPGTPPTTAETCTAIPNPA